MKYAIYLTWFDGDKDSFVCDNKFDRDLNIKCMKNSDDYKEVSYCKVYKNGEYGDIKTVKGAQI